ncbi:MAG: hypothetical protein HKM93_08920 [Desulfobacteraceae bacterium]|nr:hypothetical protein [Desulfobacteraceae bacterium]
MRIKRHIGWPDLPRLREQTIDARLRSIVVFFEKLRSTLTARDRQVALAVNAADIEIVNTEPSGVPEFEAPQLKLFKSRSWRLYVYTGTPDGWVYFEQP